MFRFLDNNDELWERYTDSSTIQRRWFFSQLILDIKNLRQQVQALWKDMCVRDCVYLAVRSPKDF
jgi:hypothetical protein